MPHSNPKGSVVATAPIEAGAETVDLGALSDLAGYHLRRASGAVAADFARVLAGTGVRQVLFGILSVVGANPGINQGSVGRHLGIQRANMVALINELVDAGSVERRVSSEDRRAFALTLSDAGQVLFDECLARIHVHERAMLAGLTEAERKQLILLLQKIEAQER
jgi:DNA-binding MarR family transcriptional regulator